ncbi:MAG: DUF4270 family protein [Bacteroidia bacterium]|nr:DUF4270 family protein [Bacteroidia bacterium]
MKNTIHLWLFAMVAAAIFFVAGCERPIGGTGIDVLPENDIISLQYSDTTTIVMETRWLEESNTYRSARQLFGNYIDPYFGKITAATCTEFLARSGLNFGDSADLIFDSLVLSLNIDGAYGRVQTVQNLRIYELTQSFPDAITEMMSSDTLAYNNSRDLAQGYQLVYEDEKDLGVVKIRLDDALGKKILFASPDTLADRDLFNQLFKGIYIGTDPVTYLSREPGAIFSLFGISNDTRLRLYYREKDPDTTTYTAKNEPFLISGSTPRYHNLKRTDYEAGLLPDYLSQPDTSAFYEFIQGGLEMKVFLKFPHIDKIEESAISKAELVIYVDQEYLGSERRFQPPFQLETVFADENGEEELIDGEPVYISSPAPYNEESGTYNISLTNYVQQLVGGSRENYGLFIVANNRAFQINRAAIGGTDNPTLKPVLRLIYTNLPK